MFVSKYGIHTKIDIPHTERELYDDWNLGIDKLGIILGYEANSRNQEEVSIRGTS